MADSARTSPVGGPGDLTGRTLHSMSWDGSQQESWRRVDVDDASECALTREEYRGVRAIETGAMDVAAEIGHEHAVVPRVERDADRFLEAGHEDLGGWPIVRALARGQIHGRAVDGVAAGGIAAVGPVHHPARQVELEVDGFRQALIERLDVGPICRSPARWDLDRGAADDAESGVVAPLLRPVDLTAVGV